PTNDLLNIDIRLPKVESGTIEILDLSGRVIKSHNFQSSHEHALAVDLSPFPAGMYQVCITTPSQRIVKKAIKK
ncbi:MAG: T9SS type A sorting domain-containing protein, partial [Bacteroidota bacterium]